MNNAFRTCYACNKIIPFNEDCECLAERQERQKKRKQEYKREWDKDNDHVKLIRTRRWSALRELVIKRDKGICQRCLAKYDILNSKDLEVHHIKPRSKYPELTFDDKNLITICQRCNSQLGTSEELDFEPITDLDDDYQYNL